VDSPKARAERERDDRVARLGRRLGSVRVAHAIVSLDHVIARVEAVLAVLVFTAMVVLVALPPVFRAVSYAGEYSWMLKAPTCLLLWIAFLGASIATRIRRHVVIDVVTKMLPLRGRAALGVLGSLLSAAVCAVFTAAAVLYVAGEWETVYKGLQPLTYGQVYLVLPACLLVMTVRFLLNGLEDLDGALTGDVAYLKEHELDETAGQTGDACSPQSEPSGGATA
jgi:TRAP-type C4-dicarboxylate transport system permease small subunit